MNNETRVASEFVKTHPADAARTLERFQIEEIVKFLGELPPTLAARVVQQMDGVTAAQCLQLMELEHLVELVTELPIEITTLLLRRIDPSRCESILRQLPNEQAESLRLTLRYPQGTAGALMNPQVFTLPNDITATEALERVRKSLARHGVQSDQAQPPRNPGFHRSLQSESFDSAKRIDQIYVVNRSGVLVGLIHTHQLMLAGGDERIVSIVQRNVGKLSPNMNHQAILAHPGWRDFHALPVVNKQGVFLGAIDYQTLRQLDSDATARRLSQRRDDAGSALGELYGIGLSALIRAASIVSGEVEE
jgi:magnesium transporter